MLLGIRQGKDSLCYLCETKFEGTSEEDAHRQLVEHLAKFPHMRVLVSHEDRGKGDAKVSLYKGPNYPNELR